MLWKGGLLLGVGWEEEGDAVVDGEDAGAVLAGEGGFWRGGDADAGALFGGLEKWTHINIKTDIGISCGYNFCATVVTILTHLGNHDTWLTTL